MKKDRGYRRSGRESESGRDIKRRKADHHFKKFLLCGAVCVVLCGMAVLFGEGLGVQICMGGTGIVFLAGLLQLCFAQAEEQEPYLVEPYEELCGEQLEELKKMLETEQQKMMGMRENNKE